jgi:hypothetical protein
MKTVSIGFFREDASACHTKQQRLVTYQQVLLCWSMALSGHAWLTRAVQSKERRLEDG